MKIRIIQVKTHEDLAGMLHIHQQVFENQMGIKLAPGATRLVGRNTHLLALVGDEPVGTLSVIDTSGNQQLHESFGLQFEEEARVARYIHLAVLKPYRLMNIPLALMLDAYRSVIVPREFDYSWLLFDVERAAKSFLSRHLGFNTLPQTFVSEYGCRCPLVREERTPHISHVIDRAEEYLRQVQSIAA
jgi:hypothetical protein